MDKPLIRLQINAINTTTFFPSEVTLKVNSDGFLGDITQEKIDDEINLLENELEAERALDRIMTQKGEG